MAEVCAMILKFQCCLQALLGFFFSNIWKKPYKILHLKNIKSVKSISLQTCQKYCYLYCFNMIIQFAYIIIVSNQSTVRFFPSHGSIAFPNMNYILETFRFFFNISRTISRTCQRHHKYFYRTEDVSCCNANLSQICH